METRPDIPDLVHLGETSARRFAANPLFGVRRDGVWRWTTYGEFWEQVADLRGGLAAHGIGPGDRVAIVSRNSVEWAVTAYATYSLGAELVPMYEAQRPIDWELILQDSGAVVVFGRTSRIATLLDGMRPRLPALRHVFEIEGADDDPRSFAALRRIGRAQPVLPVYPEPDAIAGLIYTSGTTGRPKGVILTHRNLASNVAATISSFPIVAEDRTLSFLPWAHAYGQTGELHCLIAVGASTAFNDDINRLTEDLGEVRPTMLVAVPRIFNKIHAGVRTQIAGKPRPIRALFHRGVEIAARRHRGEQVGIVDRLVHWLADRLLFARIRRKFGGRLKYAISASATLSPDVGEFIDALGIAVYEGYGLTETSPVVAFNRPGARKMGSVGQVIQDCRIRIDETTGETPGEGEIIVYGPNVMKGYHERPDENAHAFTADGGFRTGDLGRIDADGYLFITGRLKEQYKLENGKYVMPGPIEETLTLSPFMSSVMLYGAGRPYNVALIVPAWARVRTWADEHGVALDPDPTKQPAVRELIARELDRVLTDLPSYERPRGFVLATEDFTIENGMLTPTLKPKRREILARYRADLEALYQPPPPPPEARAPAGYPAPAPSLH
jgi:long-chain acyl-CoA synthetase